MLYMLIKDITNLLYDQSVDKKFDKYDTLLELTFFLFDHVREDMDNYYKVVITEIVNRVINMEIVPEDDKLELRKLLEEYSAFLAFETNDLDELIRCLLIPKVEPTIVVSNTLYTSSSELFSDFRKIVVKRSAVSKKYREKVYSYMYSVASILLNEIDSRDIDLSDNKDLLWILRMIVKTDEFRDAYDKCYNKSYVDLNRGKGLYYRFTYNF